LVAETPRLALLGGRPHFSRPLHVGAPNVVDREAVFRRLRGIFDRNRLTNGGPEEQELEETIARQVGVRHCVAVVNATTALQILCRALDWRGEVIVPSFTFVATANALSWLGIQPVFCDVDPGTHNIDPRRVEDLVTERTAGILGVHLWGRPCDVDALQAIAARRNVDLVFDAAQAWGCSAGGAMIGRFGRAEVFSFHATKWVHAFEGGAITTNDGELAERCAAMKRFGFVDFDRTAILGTNGTMTELAAAMGIVSVQTQDVVRRRNRENFDAYADSLRTLPGVKIVTPAARDDWHYHHVVLEIDEAVAPLGRDEVQRVLWEDNVLARRYFHPGCHRLEPYRSSATRRPLPVTERLAGRTLALPTGLQMDARDATLIAQLMWAAFEQAPAVRAAVAQLPDLTDAGAETLRR
jgi:dTDP-4-amino-4,6-dideoxygalactose transaminase